jgi:hypothetical protein
MITYNNISKSVLDRLVTIVDINVKLNFTYIDLEKKESTYSNAGIGLFTKEFIKKDTVFLYCKNGILNENSDIGWYINDLGYKGNCKLYFETDEFILEHTNVGFIKKIDIINNHCEIWAYSLRDIEQNEELSIYYGIKYWQKYEKEKDMELLLSTKNLKYVPSFYIHYSELLHPYREENNPPSLYIKQVDGKYYYLFGYGGRYVIDSDNSELLLSQMVDITKKDYSLYNDFDEILNGYWIKSVLIKFRIYLHNSKCPKDIIYDVLPIDLIELNPKIFYEFIEKMYC